MNTFKIRFPVEANMVADFQPDEKIHGESKLQQAIWALDIGCLYVDWNIEIDSNIYDFIGEDISGIWSELPDLLEYCMELEERETLYFAAQGRHMVFSAEPSSSEDELLISVISQRHHPEYWRKVDLWEELRKEQRVPVTKQHFLAEWKAFITNVINVLVENQIIESDDPSISEYLNQMP